MESTIDAVAFYFRMESETGDSSDKTIGRLRI